MSDPKARCSYCMKSAGRLNIKTCSRCRMVRYCSKECQKVAWITHKNCCSSALRDSLANDSAQAATNTALSKWVNHWRDSLHQWSIWALNMPNHPRDRLSTHCFVIQLEKRLNPSSPQQSFRMMGGEVMTRAQVPEILLEMDSPIKFVEGWENDRRGDDTVRIVIIAEGLVRFLWFSLRDAESRRTKQSRPVETPDISNALARDWEENLIDVIERGDGSATRGYLMRVAMRVLLDSQINSL